MAMNQESLWKAAVTAIAARRSSIFSWNTGFASERAGSPMIITTPVARRIGSVHQIAGRKRFVTRRSGWSRPTIPSSRRSSISTEDITAAIARIWIVCTVGTTHPALWIAWLSGVCSSQEQNLSRAWVRIQLGRIPVMACSAGIVDLPSGGKYPRGISRPGGLERFLRSFSQAARRGAPLVLIPGAGLHHEQVRRFDEHRGAVAHGIPLLLRLRSDFLRALLGDDGLDRIPDGVRGRIDHPLHQLLQAQHGPRRARRRRSGFRGFAATELRCCGEQNRHDLSRFQCHRHQRNMRCVLGVLTALLFSGAQAAAQDTAKAPSFVTWREPNEGAYTLGVPRGWKISGGIRRHTPVDVRSAVQVVSPDEAIHLYIGDYDLIPRREPDAATRIAGLQEGRVYNETLIGRYLTGAQFAQGYPAWKLCRRPQIIQSGILRRETETVNAQGAQYGRSMATAAVASAGEAIFRCGEGEGFVMATTLLARPASGAGVSMWFVYQLAGFVTRDPAQGYFAKYILSLMLASLKMNPEWEAKAAQAAGQYANAMMQMSNAVTQSAVQHAR